MTNIKTNDTHVRMLYEHEYQILRKRTLSAFTMAEAIIVMTILGIIATIMITNLKPSEFRDKGLQIQAKKVLQQLDTATQQIMINNTQNGKLTTIYIPNSTTQFSYNDSSRKNDLLVLYKKYLTISRKPCTNKADCGTCGVLLSKNPKRPTAYLKDGACFSITGGTTEYDTIFPGESKMTPAENLTDGILGYIDFDINGLDEPNKYGKDIFVVPINQDGIFYD